MTSKGWIAVTFLPENGLLPCVAYHKAHIRVMFGKSNIRERLAEFFLEAYSPSELKESEDSSGYASYKSFYFSTSISSQKDKIRLVITKFPRTNTVKEQVSFRKDQGKEWSREEMFIYWNYWYIETRILATIFGDSSIVFVDKSGNPTKMPVFTLRKKKDQVIITAHIKAISKEELKQAFSKTTITK